MSEREDGQPVFEPSDGWNDPPSEPPPGGWKPVTCSFDSHAWTLEIEDGWARIVCADPCNADQFDPAGETPTCLVDWLAEDHHTPAPIPVALTYVDDSTPSTPDGPAEYGYYIEVRLPVETRTREGTDG